MTVTTLPYELHPEIPVGGISLQERWGARYGEATRMYERIEAECEAAGLPFRRPARVPNTHRALETSELVRQAHPGVFDRLERALFEAHFVDNAPLDDADVLDGLVAASGADASEVREAVDAGVARAAIDASMAAANEVGVTGTPAWLVDRRFLIPGAQPRDVIERVVQRLREAAT